MITSDPFPRFFRLNWYPNTRIKLRAAIIATQALIIRGIVLDAYGSFGVATWVKWCRNSSSLHRYPSKSTSCYYWYHKMTAMNIVYTV
ncbi:hypothetical protein EYC80_006542 [Monilinia laxa]|uniref:Uncharacterized protein n=1 Tax=Monilinia laxa TaxID=61186 RepID=A0A5N6JTP8_MONLA|nr:hypothetical protein EYC80_006542 [Monilinia laxa]